jgi:hypothetical protein
MTVTRGSVIDDMPGIDSIPQQVATASQFVLDAEGRIDLLPDPPIADDLQRTIYQEVRYKADALSALGHNQLADLAEPVGRFRAVLPTDIEHASIARLWSRGNSLRRHFKAHEIAAASAEPDPARLPPLVAGRLGDLIDTFNVFITGDPKGRELDQVRLGPQERSSAQAVADAALPIMEAARTSEGLSTAAVVDTLTEGIEVARDAPAGIEGDQAIDQLRKTTGNFVITLLRSAYAGVRAEPGFAWKEYRAGIYRGLGATTAVGLAGWPIIAFVRENADVLKAFVEQALHNPTLVRIIEVISQFGGVH